MGHALVLNATYEPLCVVPARRALLLVLMRKAVAVEDSDLVLHSATLPAPRARRRAADPLRADPLPRAGPADPAGRLRPRRRPLRLLRRAGDEHRPRRARAAAAGGTSGATSCRPAAAATTSRPTAPSPTSAGGCTRRRSRPAPPGGSSAPAGRTRAGRPTSRPTAASRWPGSSRPRPLPRTGCGPRPQVGQTPRSMTEHPVAAARPGRRRPDARAGRARRRARRRHRLLGLARSARRRHPRVDRGGARGAGRRGAHGGVGAGCAGRRTGPALAAHPAAVRRWSAPGARPRSRCTSRTASRCGCTSTSRTAAGSTSPQVDRWVDAAGRRRRAGGRGDVRRPGRPAAGLARARGRRADRRRRRGGAVPLVVTPDRLEPAGRGWPTGRPTWGLMTQLYSVRSRRSWGHGDLDDLGRAGPVGRRRSWAPGSCCQPAARAVADRAGRAVAVPAGDPAVRQPAVHPGRAGAGARLPDRRGARRDRAHARCCSAR